MKQLVRPFFAVASSPARTKTRARRGADAKTRLNYETLENRHLLAGDLLPSIVGDSLIDLDAALSTKFFVVDSGVDDMFEYNDSGNPLADDTWSLVSGKDPKGATANAAGSTVWVIDKNRTVSVYDADGAALGSWTPGGLNRPEGIATDETDIWILDRKNKDVYRYANAAGKTSGSQNAASSFALDGANSKPKGITTDGSSIWVVNDGKKNGDRVFKYNLAGNPAGKLDHRRRQRQTERHYIGRRRFVGCRPRQ